MVEEATAALDPTGEPPRVVAVVLNWNGWKDTIECLESLQRSTCPLYRVVAVDNASTNDSLERIRDWTTGELPVTSAIVDGTTIGKPLTRIEYEQQVAEAGGLADRESLLDAAPPNRRLVILRNPSNLGFAGGMNTGIRYARERGAKYVWLVNNDTVVAPDALAPLVETMQELGSTGIAGPLELAYYEPEQIVDSIGFVYPWRGVTGGIPKTLRRDSRGRADVGLLSGFNLLVRTAALDAVGLMDEGFFLYVEETEWCVRMRRGGWRLTYVPEAKVWHKGSQSTGWGSPLMYYYTTRNQLRLFARHYPYAIPCVIGRSGLRMMKLLVRGRWWPCLATLRGLFDWMLGRSGMIRGVLQDGGRSRPEDANTGS